eukprot:3684978-Prymnesium_polylepis.1
MSPARMRSFWAISRPSAPSGVSSRIKLKRMRFAFDAAGVLGWFAWWPAYPSRMLMYRTLLPGVRAGSSVLTATELT